MVHLVLQPQGIEPTFLKLNSWSPGAGLIPIIYSKGIKQIRKGKIVRKKKFSSLFAHIKRKEGFF